MRIRLIPVLILLPFSQIGSGKVRIRDPQGSTESQDAAELGVHDSRNIRSWILHVHIAGSDVWV